MGRSGSVPKSRRGHSEVVSGAVEGEMVLPLVEHARWSTHVEVKRDAVEGLYSLAQTEANKEIMGKMGALHALFELVFTEGATAVEKKPTTGERFFLTRTPAAAIGREASSAGATSSALVPIGSPSGKQLPSLAVGLPDLTVSRMSSDGYVLPGTAHTDHRALATRMEKRSFKRSEGDVKLLRTAAATLADLLTCEANQNLFVELGGLEKAHAMVLRVHSVPLRQSLAQLFTNLAKNDVIKVKLMNAQVLSPLFDLTTSSDERTRLLAVAAVKRLSSSKQNQLGWPESGLRTMVSWLGQFTEVRLQLLALDSICNIAEVEEMRTIIVNAGGVPFFAAFLDIERYDDEIRLLAAKCISKLAAVEAVRSEVGSMDVLLQFKNLIEQNLVVYDAEQLRRGLDALVLLADNTENKKKLADVKYITLLFQGLSAMDKIAKRASLKVLSLISSHPESPPLFKIYTQQVLSVMKGRDYFMQVSATEILYYLTEHPDTLPEVIPYTEDVMKMLNHWVQVPDEAFNTLVTKLAANVAAHDEGRKLVTSMLPVMKTFMNLTKSKASGITENSTRFLHNLTNTDEEGKATLVAAGAVWRLNSVAKSSRATAKAKIFADSALKTHLVEHVSAIRIQAIYRGRFERRLAQKRLERARAEKAARG